MKQIIAFDLDGTLTESRSAVDPEMTQLICKLLSQVKVAIIGGGSPEQFKEQFVDFLDCSPKRLENLYLLPTNGSSFYVFQKNKWNRLYKEEFKEEERKKILGTLDIMFKEIGFKPGKTYGDLIQDRGSQITFSGLGDKAPLDLKKKWDPDQKKRSKMIEVLKKYIPEFEISMGGTTSIDITRKGVDKAYGMKKFLKEVGVSKSKVIFLGDALFPGGNDWSVKKLGIETVRVEGPQETKEIIKKFISDVERAK